MLTRLMILFALPLTLAQTALAQAPTAPAATSTAAAAHVDFYRNTAAHTGYTDDKLTTPLSLLWRHTTVAAKDSPASPVYAGGTIYFGAGQNLYAVNAADGTLKWKYPAKGAADGNFRGTPALAGGALYAGSDGGSLFKLDAKTGDRLWALKAGGPIRSSPIVADGIVYFGCGDSRCYAVSADNGQAVWSYGTEGPIVTSPTLADGQIVFASSDNTVYCVNSRNGRRVWAQQFQFDVNASPPVFADGSVYFGAGDTLYAYSASTGGARWRRRLSAELSTPATIGSDGMIYVCTQDNKVYGLSERGRPVWTTDIANPSFASPLLAGDTLLVPTQRGILYALDASNGKLRWDYVLQPSAAGSTVKPTFTDVVSAPVWADKSLYTLSDDGSLSAFRTDVVDQIGPEVSGMFPKPGATVAGARVFPSATLIDEGSGINPATVTLTLDSAYLPLAKYDPSKNSVGLDQTSEAAATAIPTLLDGAHQITVTATDWRGNKTTRTWGFIADNRFDPAGSSPPSALTPVPSPATPSLSAPPPPPANPPTPAPNAAGGGNGAVPPPPPPI